MNRGDIWLGIWPNDPEKKQRPLLIISNNIRNQEHRLLDIVVLKLTSLQNSSGKIKPTNPAEDVVINLRKPTIIRCASIFTIEKSSLTTKLTQLQTSDITSIDACLRNVLDLN